MNKELGITIFGSNETPTCRLDFPKNTIFNHCKLLTPHAVLTFHS